MKLSYKYLNLVFFQLALCSQELEASPHYCRKILPAALTLTQETSKNRIKEIWEKLGTIPIGNRLMAGKNDPEISSLIDELSDLSSEYLRAYFLSRGKKTSPDGEEVADACIPKIVSAIDSFDPSKGNKFTTYLTAISNNFLIDLSRTRYSRTRNVTESLDQSRPTDDFSLSMILEDSKTIGAQTILVEDERRELVSLALQEYELRFGELNRKIVEEYYGLSGSQALSSTQLATKFNIPRSTITHIIDKARIFLRRSRTLLQISE